MVIHATHDHRLVLLSIVISIMAAYAAIALAERIRMARGRVWMAWVAGAGVVDGIGTWSMHYTAKLALRLPVPLMLDARIVVLSLLVGIAGSMGAFAIASGSRVRAVLAGIVLGGVGVSGLHFVAMSGIRLDGMRLQHRSTPLILTSVALAVIISSASFAIAFLSRDDSLTRAFRMHGVAVIRGMANPAMHYTAMAAVVFVYTNEVRGAGHLVSIASLGVVGISVVPAMVISVGLLTTFVDRLQRQRALLGELFEQTPQAVALTDANDRVIRVNREFTRLFGYGVEELKDRELAELIVPEELRDEDRSNIELATSGERVDVETVRLRKDGEPLHVSMQRVPVTVPGGEIQTYAMFRDISLRKRAEEALRAYPRRLLETQEAERRRIARELHDEIGQVLTSCRLMLQLSAQMPSVEARERVREAELLLEDLIARVRNLALDLRPPMLDDFGLSAALTWLLERYEKQIGLRVELDQFGVEGHRFDPDVETAAYRIVQEALTNVARHSQVREAAVRIWRSEHILGVEIEDRGAGFDPQPAPQSTGLAGMRERVEMLGGRVSIESAHGEGTRISAEIPLH